MARRELVCLLFLQELQDSIEQPALRLAQSGRRAA